MSSIASKKEGAGMSTAGVGAESNKKVRHRRAIPLILKALCESKGLHLVSLSHGWLNIVQSPTTNRSINILGGCFPVNTQNACAVAKDKCATASVLRHHGVPCIPSDLVTNPNLVFSGFDGSSRARRGTMPKLMSMLQKYPSDGIVLKPNCGHGGKNVIRVRCQLELEAAFLKLNQAPARAYVVAPFFPLQDEWRCVVLDGRVRLCFRKVRPRVVGDGVRSLMQLASEYESEVGKSVSYKSELSGEELEKIPAKGEVILLSFRHNVSTGAKTDTNVPEDFVRNYLEPLAQKAMSALGLEFASVDIVKLFHPDKFADFSDGRELAILEVNSTVMLDGFLSQHPEYLYVAQSMYSDILDRALLLC